jgi:DNA-binding MarR family transcriptional regulator
MINIEEKLLDPFSKGIMTLRLLPLFTIGSNFLNKDNLNEKQIIVLIMINHAENQALISTIADELFMDRPQVSRLVDTLEDLGFVNRKLMSRKQNKQADRRKVKLEMTDKGLAFLSEFYEDRNQFHKEIIESFGEQEAKEFSQYLERFNDMICEKIRCLINQKSEKS